MNRREFIAGLGALIGAAVVAHVVPAATSPLDREMDGLLEVWVGGQRFTRGTDYVIDRSARGRSIVRLPPLRARDVVKVRYVYA